jgi:hypothetical protein
MKLERLLRVLPKSLVDAVEIASQKMSESARSRLLVQMAVRFQR